MRAKGRVFLIDDDGLILSMLSRALGNEGYEVQTYASGEEVVSRVRSFNPDVVMLDIRLPGKSGMELLEEIVRSGMDTQVVMLTSDDTAETAIRAMKLGAVDYLTKPFHLDEVVLVIGKVIENERMKRELRCLRMVSSDLFEVEFLGESDAARAIRAKAEKIANAHVPTVLFTGESGTGKEVLARHIHRGMHDEDGSGGSPFVPINCTALPEALLESELFGYEKGSFTDAKADKKGVFELAAGGSILLDEIGDMKPNLQAKLLRVLEGRAVRRIGGNEEIPVDVTVLATTNRDLSDAIGKGEFRTDLFFRLNAFSLHIPPLRERKEDIPVLARHFLSSFSRKYNKPEPREITPQAEKILVSYGWPGNARELKNVIERIVVLESGETVLPEHLPKEMHRKDEAQGDAPRYRFLLPEAGICLEEVEKDLILQALDKARNNKTLAAKLLNVSYDSLRYQIKKFGLE